MTINREMLAAYAEGQLNEEGRALVEAAMIAEPSLAEVIAQHRALRERLQARFNPVLTMPVPAKLADAVRASAPKAEIADLNVARAAKAEKMRNPSFTRWAMGGSIAAALAIGLVVGNQMPGRGSPSGIDGLVVAQGALDEALTTQPASTAEQPVKVLLSLRDTEGRYCRVFQASETAGIACRDDDRWAVERLEKGKASQGEQYRQAGSELGEIMAAAQAMASKGALNPEQEQEALKSGWK